jgi:hypothetical protein
LTVRSVASRPFGEESSLEAAERSALFRIRLEAA